MRPPSRRFAAAASAWTLLLPGGDADLATGGRAFGPGEAWEDRALPAAHASPAAWRFDRARDDVVHAEGDGPAAAGLRRETHAVAWERPGRRTGVSLAAAERRLLASWQNRLAQGASLAQDSRSARALLTRCGEGGSRAFVAFAERVEDSRGGAWGFRAEGVTALRATAPGPGARARDGASRPALRAALWQRPVRLALAARDGASRFDFPLDWTLRGSSVEASAPLARGLRLRAGCGGGALQGAARGAAPRAAGGAFSLVPSLPWRTARLELVAPGAAGSWGVRYERHVMEGRADGFDTGVRFARAHALAGRLERVTAGVERRLGAGHRLIAGAERVDLGVASRGDIETWPFTPALVDLLGLRARYDASVALRVWRLQAGAEHRLGESWDLGWGANRLVADLDARAATWQTDVMVFGVNGLRRHRFDLRRVEGWLLTAGLGRELGPLRLDYTFLQAVPTRIARRGGDGAPGGPSASPDPGGGGFDGVRWGGGRLHALRVGWAR